jgi:hypothetical protein
MRDDRIRRPRALSAGQGQPHRARQAARLHPPQLRRTTSRAPGSSRTARSGCTWNWKPRPGSGACCPTGLAGAAVHTGLPARCCRLAGRPAAGSSCTPTWAWAWCTAWTWATAARPWKPALAAAARCPLPRCRRVLATSLQPQPARLRLWCAHEKGRPQARAACWQAGGAYVPALAAALAAEARRPGPWARRTWRRPGWPGRPRRGAISRSENAPPLCGHRALALERRVQQRVVAGLDARAPRPRRRRSWVRRQRRWRGRPRTDPCRPLRRCAAPRGPRRRARPPHPRAASAGRWPLRPSPSLPAKGRCAEATKLMSRMMMAMGTTNEATMAITSCLGVRIGPFVWAVVRQRRGRRGCANRSWNPQGSGGAKSGAVYGRRAARASPS